MMRWMRNRELRIQLALSLASVVAAAGCAWWAVGVYAGVATGVCGLVTVVVSMGFALWRYRRLAALAARVDRVLAGERDVSLDDMHEGELAILSSQLSKTLSRLQVANDELDAERRALADALADISHQLRTPLTSLGLTLALISRDATTPTHHARVRDAERLLDRVQWLVGSLLKLARLDAGVVRLERAPIDVQRLVVAAYEALAVSFDLADVGFCASVEPGLSFWGDAAWTREALSNVLKNCLEHTPAGGMVSLRAWEDGVASRIRIEDCGPGIAQKDLPHVFERFYRGDNDGGAGEANPRGVGIGLPLARALVVAQDGSLEASNAYDEAGAIRGARFDMAFYKLVV